MSDMRSPAELTVGDTIPGKRFDDVSIDEMRLMSAIMRDYNPLHFDPRAPEESGQSKRLVQAPIYTSYTTQTVLELVDHPYDIESYSVRYEDNLFEGESIETSGTVVESESVDAGTRLMIDLETSKPDGTVVLSGSATILVREE